MLRVTEHLVNEINFLKRKCIKLIVDEDVIKNANSEELELVQRCMNLMDLACKVSLEQAKAIDDINRKLDKLLSRK